MTKRREHPHRVDRSTGLVSAGGGREQVEGVGDGEQREPSRQAPQTHRRSPAEQGQQRGHHEKQQHVEQRVRESRDDRRGATTGDGQDRTEERCSDTGNREAADNPVEPQAERDVLGELPDDEVQRDKGARVETQPQRVGRGRERFRVLSTDEHRPDDVAEPVQSQPDAEHVEAATVGLHVPGPQQADSGAAEVGQVVQQPVQDQVVATHRPDTRNRGHQEDGVHRPDDQVSNPMIGRQTGAPTEHRGNAR